VDSPSVFVYRSHFSCGVAELYEWHARNGALERLIPPWENTKVVSKKGGIDPGGRVEMLMHAGPIPFRWVAHHIENISGKMFRDIQYKGPFALWSHSHIFTENGSGACLEDKIEYSLPGHTFIPGFIKNNVKNTLQRTFQHRQSVLKADLLLHQQCSKKPMRVLISGASGVLGRALIPLLTTGGHEVWTLVRRPPNRDKNELYWNPLTSEIDTLPPVDAVIHLAGEYIGLGRWSEAKKKMVVESRTKGTAILAKTIAGLSVPPKVFLSASAVGFYGDTKEILTDEYCGVGKDYISEVCNVWEAAAEPARNVGIRTVLMRIGVTLTPGGGALQRLMSTSALGFLRRFGSGEQYISWISIDDTISAMLHALWCEKLEGPLNISAPFPVTNKEFMQTLASVVQRPLFTPVPASLLKMIYGQMATEILLSGCRASCKKLLDSGFRFRHVTLEEALRSLLGKFDLEHKREFR
jgi:uncharacterized protein (TIGR01777 family)